MAATARVMRMMTVMMLKHDETCECGVDDDDDHDDDDADALMLITSFPR